MARPRLHRTDDLLDAARDLVLQGGVRAATIAAIARAGGAPTGSLYHRFGSRDDMLAELWGRAVRRSQRGFLAALRDDDPRAAAVAAALATYDFAADNRPDARLLAALRREDLVATVQSPRLALELADLNRPAERAVRELARRLYGHARSDAVARTALAVIDIPLGAVKRYLLAGARLPPGLRDDIAAAVGAVLDREGREHP